MTHINLAHNFQPLWIHLGLGKVIYFQKTVHIMFSVLFLFKYILLVVKMSILIVLTFFMGGIDKVFIDLLEHTLM